MTTSSGQRVAAKPVSLVLAAGPGNGRYGIRLPAFPEIRSDLPGFCLPHIHSGGLPVDASERDTCLYGLHELLHWWVAEAFMLRAMRLTMFYLWDEIIRHAEGRSPDALHVPVLPDPDGPECAKIVNSLAVLFDAIKPVQEVFAVSVSLYLAEAHGVISAEERKVQRRLYKRAYRHIPDFTTLYDPFEAILNVYGFAKAVDLAYGPLNTPWPTWVCSKIMSGATLDGAWQSPIAFVIDKDEDKALDYVERVECEIEYFVGANVGRDFPFLHCLCRARPYLEGAPGLPWLCAFDEKGWDIEADLDVEAIAKRFGLQVPRQPVYPDGQEVLDWYWLESIRQQLMTGIGLQCPFYDPGRDDCCGGRERRWLEGLLAHTVGTRTWRPRGCLLRQH